MSKEKQYGLIIPKKDQGLVVAKPSIFDDSSEDERETVEKTIQKEALRTMQKKQTQLEMQRALTEDPTVYQYDSIYDDLQKKKEIRKITKKKETGPKYIESLLKSAENRKKEYERRTERKIQKEREEEGEEFADKEEFVTSSYKKKMEEMQREEEEERKRSIIEARLDVTKQSDLSGFYRHILKETTDDVPQIKEEKISSEEEQEDTNQPPDLRIVAQKIVEKNRSSKEKPGQQEDNDSEFSVDSESSSESSSSDNNISRGEADMSTGRNGSRTDKQKKSPRKSKMSSRRKRVSESSASKSDTEPPKKVQNLEKESVDFENVNEGESLVEPSESKESGVKEKKQNPVDRMRELFKKRNTGEVLEAAKERYFARKAAREAAKTVFA